MTARLILLLLLVMPSLLRAQTIDPGSLSAADSAAARKKATDSTHHTDTTRYHYSYSGTGSLNSTNSLRTYLLNNAAKLSMTKQSATVNLSGSWIYGKQSLVLTNDDVASSLGFDLYKAPLKHMYYWGMANYNTSISLLINHQLQVAAGAGYNLIDKKTAFLNISDGPLYEKGDLYDSLYGGPNGNVYQRDRYHTVRNSFRLLYHWILHDRYTFDGTGFLQNAFSNWNDYALRLSGSVSIKLEKWLSFTVAGTYNRFTRTRSKNTILTFGLTVQR